MRSLFAEEGQDDGGRPKRTWYAGVEDGAEWEDDGSTVWWCDDDGAWWDEETYYTDWPSSPSGSWDDGYGYDYNVDYDYTEGYYDNEVYEKSAEEKRMEEAFTIAAEANKTLAEAKAAVAKVRAARGYYDPAGMKGHAGKKGKAKSGKAGKGKGLLGPCFTCGRPGHTYQNCPDRWSLQHKGSSFVKGKGKMAMKGKKGSKGKKAYHMENYVPEINVLSLQESEELQSIASEKVVIDTGATESVAGVASMSRLVDGGRFQYSVHLDDRPRFRFGNGQTQRAVSKVKLECPALGEVSFHLLDQGADNTPPLLGARDLRARHALVSYKGDWLAHKTKDKWWASSLETLSSGHLALDLLQPREPLQALLKRLQNDPFNVWPGRDRDDHHGDEHSPPGDDGDGDGNDPHRGNKRHRGRVGPCNFGSLVGAATQSGAYGGPREADHGEEQLPASASPFAKTEDFGSASFVESPDVLVKDEPKGKVCPGGTIDLSSTPTSPERLAAADAPVEPASAPVHAEAVEKDEAHQPEVGHQPVLDESMPAHVPHGDTLHGAAVESHVHAEPPHGPHAHGNPPEDSRPCQHVLMVWRSDGKDQRHETMDERLSCLAQRLQQLKQRYSPQPHEIGPSCGGVGSSPTGMAMWWNAQGGQREVQPVRNMAELHTLRVTPALCEQDALPGRYQSCWTSYGPCDGGPTGVAERLRAPADDRKDLQWKADGDQGPTPSDVWWTWPNVSAGACRRAPGPLDDWRDRGGREDGDKAEAHDEGQGQSGIDAATKGVLTCTKDSGTRKPFFQQGRCDPSWIYSGQAQPTEACEDQEGAGRAISACDSAADSSGCAISAGNGRIGRGGDQQQRGGQGQGREQGRLNALWNSLKNLQDRIRGKPKSADMAILADKCPQQLEAAEGNMVSCQPSTLTSTRKSSTMSPMTTSTTKNSNSTEVPKDDKNTCGHFGRIESEMDEMFNITEKTVKPSLAKRLAKAAMLTTALMGPMRELIGAVQPQIDIMEIACSPESALTQEFVDNGFTGMRINYRNGFDLDSKKGTNLLVKEIKEKHPKLAWVSMVCTRMSSLQNLTPRTPEQQDRFLKRKGQDLRRCDDVVTGLEEVLQHGDDLAWEWPSSAVAGWRSRPLQRLQRLIKRYNRQIYWINIDGCQYGLEWHGWPVKKAWTILTTSRNLWLTLNKRCDGTHEHIHCRGQIAQASSFYPPKMCKDICKAMKFSWMQQTDSLENMVEHYMLEIDNNIEETFDPGLHRPHQHHDLPLQALPGRQAQHHRHRDLPQQALHGPQEQALALSRTRLQLETAPTGKKLEAVKQLLLRVHRASGHSGMSNLVRLLKARGAPPWALELAQRLRCPECEEAAKPLPRPPASLGEAPAMFEVLGTDVFEFEMPEKEGEPNMKLKLILWRDRASGLTMIDHMQTFESKRAWEPTSQDIIKSMMKWQMVYPFTEMGDVRCCTILHL